MPKTRRTTRRKIQVEINGELWQRVGSFARSGPDDRHYTVRVNKEGVATIKFGDGERGARPPAGASNIKMTFSSGERYSAVRLMQGTVLQDDDWNEPWTRPQRFCGIYRGIVTENNDPEFLMRVWLKVPSVLDTQEAWALACTPVGLCEVPTVGDEVWVVFEGGDPEHPVWIGTLTS